MTDLTRSGRIWAWAGFGLGIGASIAANVTHSYIVQTSRGEANLVGPLISAAFWPLALLLCLEVMSRVVWPKGWQWWIVRYFGLTLVSVIAAVVSWRHMNGLLAKYGEDWFVAVIGPIAVDGLMVVCSSALLAIGHNIKKRAINPTNSCSLEPSTQDTVLDCVAQPQPMPPVIQGHNELVVENHVRDFTKLVEDVTTTPEPERVTIHGVYASESHEQKPPEIVPRYTALPPNDLLEAARRANAAYRLEHDGRPITRDALRQALHVSVKRASEVLKELRANP